MKKYISTNLQGGLGNQLFQIAIAYSLGGQYDLIPIFPKITKSYSVIGSRPVYWDNIFHKINAVPEDEFNKIPFHGVKEHGLQYREISLTSDKSYKLDGYFQCSKYNDQTKMSELFTLKEKELNQIKNIYSQIKQHYHNKQIISLHVRRGDYVKLQHFHTNLTTHYYRKAIEYFPHDAIYLIFSDDIAWCRDNLTFIPNKHLIDESLDDITSLFLMSMCDGHIIANSSFSWWGAYLNLKKNVTVVAPRDWFVPAKNNNEIQDIYKPDWIVIKQDDSHISNIGVSIIIPLYNGIEFLGEAIDSIKKQTYQNYEVIIGVNGHGTNSDVYQKALQYSSAKIRVIEYTVKSKVVTCNFMIKECKYDVICLLDADDKWETNKLEKQILIWNTNKYDVVGTFAQYFGDKSDIPRIPGDQIRPDEFWNVNPIINSSCMFRKKDAYWCTSAHNLEDYDLWLRLSYYGRKFYNINEVLTYHRIYQQSFFNHGNNDGVEALRQHWKEKSINK